MSDVNPVLQTFNSDTFSDCEVQVGDTAFKVNKIFLCVHSDVLRTYFQHDSLENRSNVVKIDGAQVEIVKAMLYHFYSMDIENLSEIAKDLFILADRYNVQDLKDRCLPHIVENINLNNLFEQFDFNNTYDVPSFKDKVLNFATENINYIMGMEQWPEFAARNNEIVLDLLGRVARRASEFEEQNATLRWQRGDFDRRCEAARRRADPYPLWSRSQRSARSVQNEANRRNRNASLENELLRQRRVSGQEEGQIYDDTDWEDDGEVIVIPPENNGVVNFFN